MCLRTTFGDAADAGRTQILVGKAIHNIGAQILRSIISGIK